MRRRPLVDDDRQPNRTVETPRAGTAPKTAAAEAARPGRSRSRAARARRRSRWHEPWARRLERTRPGLVEYVLDAPHGAQYGGPYGSARLDPISELVLTILTQNTADVNAEKAFESLMSATRLSRAAGVGADRRQHRRGGTGPRRTDATRAPDGWGGEGLPPGRPPDWAAIEAAPVEELIEVIRHGGLAYQKAPRIQAALRTIREARGDYDLASSRTLPPREARDWLTQIPGIGKKTASIVLLFCFGLPLFPIDTHVERVSKRIGLLPAKAPLEPRRKAGR